MAQLELTKNDLNWLNSQDFENFQDCKESIENCFEEFWENMFDEHSTNHSLFENHVQQINKIAEDYWNKRQSNENQA